MTDRLLTSAILWTAACSLTFLSSCSGGGGGSAGGGGGGVTSVSYGVFLDAAVEGLNYSTQTQAGLTAAGGVFKYVPGETVTFSIGDIPLGSATARPALTPVDLVTSGSVTHQKVTNMTRLLMSLDEDNNVSIDGIKLADSVRTAAAGKSLDLDSSDGVFEAASTVSDLLNAAGTGRSLPSKSGAQSHLNTTVTTANSIRQKGWAGEYSFTFSGDDSGSGTLSIGLNGAVTGSGQSSNIGSFSVSGNVSNLGVFTGNTSNGATFNFTISTAYAISGTWNNLSDGVSGTIAGNLSSRLGGHFAGTYMGGSTATITNGLSVTSGGTVTGSYAVFNGVQISGTGTVDTGGNVKLTGTATLNDVSVDATYDGNIHTPCGVASGTWSWSFPSSGTSSSGLVFARGC